MVDPNMPDTQINQAVGAAGKGGRRSSFGMLPIPQSRLVIWVNIALSLVIATIGFGVGFGEGYLSAQQVILFGVVTAALLFLLLNYIAIIFEDRAAAADGETEAEAEHRRLRSRALWGNNIVMVLAMSALLILYLLLTASIEEFRSIKNLIAFLVLELILLFAFKVSGYFASGRSAFIGLIVLGALIVISAFSIEGFLSAPNVRAILLFAAFLGIASVGQTMVALLGGLDFVHSLCYRGSEHRPAVADYSWCALLCRIWFYPRAWWRSWVPERADELQASGSGIECNPWHRVRGRRFHPDHDVHRFKIRRERLRRRSRLVEQSRRHERSFLRHKVSADNHHLDRHRDCHDRRAADDVMGT